MTRAVLLILDGLRRDFVTEALTPHLAAFARRAARSEQHRSVFPSVTRVASASIATGCHPGRHELQGNTMALLEGGTLVIHDAGHPDFLQHKRRATGRSLAMPTLAERLAPLGGAIVFSNVSPGAALAQDPDGFGHVYHRSGSFGPGRVPVPADDHLAIGQDEAGENAMTDRFIAEVLGERRPALSVMWCAEPDHIQHATALGSPEHLDILRNADARAGRVIAAVDALRAAGEDILLIVGSDHGHESVTGIVDIDAALIEAGLKASETSGDVVTAANGTAALIYLHPDHDERAPSIEAYLRSCDWCASVVAVPDFETLGHANHHGLAYLVSLAQDDGPNEHGIAGRSLAAAPAGSKPDRLGCGQHGGLGRFEQSPVLMIDGRGFSAQTAFDAPTCVVDIAPTILHHFGLPHADVDGRPLQFLA